MPKGVTSRFGEVAESGLGVAARAAVLFLPALLLFVGATRAGGKPSLMLWLGTGFQVLVCTLSLLSRQGRRQPLGPSVITLYVIALGWLWLGAEGLEDWYFHLAQAILLVVPLVVFAQQILTDSGAASLRRAGVLAQGLARRKDWPGDLAACRNLPEVKALREALHIDATPALALLTHPRLEVRVAALAAVEFRQNWRPGQAEIVLHQAQQTTDPIVRATAITALGNVNERALVEAVAEFLRDPSHEVRQAAAEALLWDSERRWPWISHAVRRALADAGCKDDGSLRNDGQLLPANAVADLTAWTTEKGILGQRAALTLGRHYSRAIAERPTDALVQQLRRQLADPHAPAALRMELVRVLQQQQELDRALLERLLDPANPAPLRLAAVEALLTDGEHLEAVAALHDLARLPNREIALATADVVQRRLGVDLGLALGEALPAVHSRQAAEVTRRVMQWATQNDLGNPDDQTVGNGRR
jgi:hypothetical protein